VVSRAKTGRPGGPDGARAAGRVPRRDGRRLDPPLQDGRGRLDRGTFQVGAGQERAVLEDALEWQAISPRDPSFDPGPRLEESVARARDLLDAAVVLGLDKATAERIEALLLRYHRLVRRELELLSSPGHPKAAEIFDEEQADPAFDVVLGFLARADEVEQARGRRSQISSNAGVMLTVLLALTMMSVIQRRLRSAEARHVQERRAERRYRTLVDQSSDLVVVCDERGRVSYLSPAAGRVLVPDRVGSSGTAAIGLNLTEVLDPADGAAFAALVASPKSEQGTRAVELRLGTPRVGYRTYEISVRDLRADPAVAGLVLTAHDVTQRRKLEEELTLRALHDPLTGLPNRALLSVRVGEALRAVRSGAPGAALLLLDLDRFKEINDTLGHHVGDGLLAQIGPRLSAGLREGVTVARLGGDEFAVLIPGVGTVDRAHQIADELLCRLEEPFRVEGLDLYVEASLGLVLSGEHGQDQTTLLRRADIAMYVAKRQGSRILAYDPGHDTHSPERLALLGDLRNALEAGQLVLHFQPQVSLSTGSVCGVEALVRWAHPTQGLLMPDSFIPLAESTGLISALTRHVIDLALMQARTWADEDRGLRIAVNVSARNLLDDQLVHDVVCSLQAHEVPAEMLVLEVTESAIIADPTRSTAILSMLRDFGVGISIDDFGAGYTSLGQLRNLHAKELKIDHSLVTGMADEPANAVIVRAVVELAHDLGFTTTAEGVETAEVLELLGLLGCDVAQGYHLARPMPVGAFDVWREEREVAVPRGDDPRVYVVQL